MRMEISFHKDNAPAAKMLIDVIKIYSNYLRNVDISYTRFKKGLNKDYVI